MIKRIRLLTQVLERLSPLLLQARFVLLENTLFHFLNPPLHHIKERLNPPFTISRRLLALYN
jgi:hypothetical protein